jgi:hypothetical protein
VEHDPMSKSTYTDPITKRQIPANGGTENNRKGSPQHGREIERELEKFNKGKRV